jgi:hypothetical protein
MKAYWKKGSQHKVDATKAYNEIERIRGKHDGAVMPEVVIMEAEKKRNPLHREFNWDDTEAAHQYRLTQARGLLRHIEVIHESAPEIPMRAFEVVTQPAFSDTPERQVYRSTEEILQDPGMRDELLARAIRDALTYRRKYHALSELSQVFQSLDDFLVKNEVV